MKLMRPTFALVVLLSGCDQASVERQPMAGANAGRGRDVAARVGCGACHVIPGIAWPQGRVGPSLRGFAGRALIAGQFPNQPEILANYVRNAPAFTPLGGMPPMPITEQEARDVAAYLYTLGS